MRLELSSEGRYALRALLYLAWIGERVPAQRISVEVVRAMDPWPHSEAGRFHRGISLVVALIAALILSVESLRNLPAPQSPPIPREDLRTGCRRSKEVRR